MKQRQHGAAFFWGPGHADGPVLIPGRRNKIKLFLQYADDRLRTFIGRRNTDGFSFIP